MVKVEDDPIRFLPLLSRVRTWSPRSFPLSRQNSASGPKRLFPYPSLSPRKPRTRRLGRGRVRSRPHTPAVAENRRSSVLNGLDYRPWPSRGEGCVRAPVLVLGVLHGPLDRFQRWRRPLPSPILGRAAKFNSTKPRRLADQDERNTLAARVLKGDRRAVARAMTIVENGEEDATKLLDRHREEDGEGVHPRASPALLARGRARWSTGSSPSTGRRGSRWASSPWTLRAP